VPQRASGLCVSSQFGLRYYGAMILWLPFKPGVNGSIFCIVCFDAVLGPRRINSTEIDDPTSLPD
jgi:hypothetical protein